MISRNDPLSMSGNLISSSGSMTIPFWNMLSKKRVVSLVNRCSVQVNPFLTPPGRFSRICVKLCNFPWFSFDSFSIHFTFGALFRDHFPIDDVVHFITSFQYHLSIFSIVRALLSALISLFSLYLYFLDFSFLSFLLGAFTIASSATRFFLPSSSYVSTPMYTLALIMFRGLFSYGPYSPSLSGSSFCLVERSAAWQNSSLIRSLSFESLNFIASLAAFRYVSLCVL